MYFKETYLFDLDEVIENEEIEKLIEKPVYALSIISDNDIGFTLPFTYDDLQKLNKKLFTLYRFIDGVVERIEEKQNTEKELFMNKQEL